MQKTYLLIVIFFLIFGRVYSQSTNCEINLSSAPIELITGQGTATGTINAGGAGITINGNGWNAIEIPQNITAGTILEFEFSSTAQGEEHAIGFSNSLASPGAVDGTRFKLYGTQNVPVANANLDFTYNGNGVQSFSIPVGQFLTGNFQYIVFVNDNDAAPTAGNSSFTNIRFVDGGGNCLSNGGAGTIGGGVTNTNPPSINHVFNFATAGTATPVGFTEDTGQPYGPKADGLTYGWRLASDNSPFDISALARNRLPDPDADPIRESFIHMDHPTLAPAVNWEIAVPNGTYRVVLQGGEAEEEDTPGTQHLIMAEGETVINFTPGNGGFGTRTGVATVTVTDGNLTLDGTGGTNAKLAAVAIQSADGLRFPAVVGALPLDGATNVFLNPTISANFLSLPNTAANGATSLNNNTLNAGTVQLFQVTGNTATPVAININGTGGGDAINLTPAGNLLPNTRYRYTLNGVQDLAGAMLFPYTAEFITGTTANTGSNTGGGDNGSGVMAGNLEEVVFNNEGSVANGMYSTLTIGPDGRLFGLRISGQIDAWTINGDGTLGGQQTFTTLNNAFGGNNRLAIGLVFAPNATAANPVAYVTHSSFAFSGGPAWDGRLSRLSGANLQNHELILTNLPRSVRDHLSNSIVFDPNNPNVLYFNQGSNSAGGAPDGAWGNRPERLLTAATLRLDLSLLPANLPLDVQTSGNINVINNAPANSIVMSDGNYNPYAVNSPLTIAGSGIRNPYDLVYHSNGQIYVPTNGTAGGSNAPASVPGSRRPNGDFYNGPAIPAANNNNTQRDFLYRINPNNPNIGYYGHTNPLRGEFVMNRGAIDVNNYPDNIQPDANYSGFAFDFAFNQSPNGVIEYRSPGALQGALIVCRFSGGDDLIVLVPDGPNGDIGTSRIGIPGFTGLDEPLDLVEDPNTGNIYVSNFTNSSGTGTNPGNITLLRVVNPGTGGSGGNGGGVVVTPPVVGGGGIVVTPPVDGQLAITPGELIYEAELNDPAVTETVTVTNNNGDALVIDALDIVGGNTGMFATATGTPLTIAAGASATISVNYNPGGTAGGFSSSLSISLDNGSTQAIGLFGLTKNGFAGNNEPTLQQIVNTVGYPFNVGGNTLSLPTTAVALGDEILTSTFQQANPAQPITLEMVGRYSPMETATFGHYTAGNAGALTELLTITNTLPNTQTLFPDNTGTTSFNVGGSFGFYGTRNGNQTFYTEDNLNTNTGVAHAWRIYPLVNRNGTPIPNAYLFTLEEATNGDYQDYIYVVFNITPMEIPPVGGGEGAWDVAFITPANDDIFLEGEDFNIEAIIENATSPIDNIQLFIDGNFIRQENIAPYTWSEGRQPDDFSMLEVGGHELRVVATNSQGNTEEAVINISIIANPTPPTDPIESGGVVRGTNIFVENMRKIPGTDTSFPFDDRVVFHRAERFRNGRTLFSEVSTVRINNVGAGVLTVSSIDISSADFEFENPADAQGFAVAANGFRDIDIRFVTNDGPRRIIESDLTVTSNDPTLPVSTLTLAGGYMEATGGNFEFLPQEIVDLFGFATQVKAPNSLINSAYPTEESIASGEQGDLVVSQLWEQADPNEPVTSMWFYAYQSPGTPRFRFINEDGETVAGFNSTFASRWYQSIFPRSANSETGPIAAEVGDINEPFAVELAGRSTLGTGFNNATGLPENLPIRMYSVINPDGSIRPNEYFATFDYAAGGGCIENPVQLGSGICDFNDVAIYITNIQPSENWPNSESCGENITIGYGHGGIKISGPEDEVLNVQVFNDSWHEVFSCNDQCGAVQTVEGLPDGVYQIIVRDDNNQIICQTDIFLTDDNTLKEETNTSRRVAGKKIQPNFSIEKETLDFQIVPNPAQHEFSVEVNTNQHTTYNVVVLDLLSKVHYEQEFEGSGDRRQISVNSSNWEAGLYYILIEDGTTVEAQQMVIIK